MSRVLARARMRPRRLLLASALAAVLLLAFAGGGAVERAATPVAAATPASVVVGSGNAVADGPVPAPVTTDATPRWRTERAIPRRGMLVAYYGTAGTGALGVLGERAPDRSHRRLARAAAAFERPGRPVRLVHELIVSIADAYPGRDGDYSHDISRDAVRRHVAAARRNGALLLLDIQTGRSDFLRIAKRWAWALAEPHVGLALDPEWRMRRGEVPGRVIGSVRAAEVNRVSAWLSRMVVRRDLPEKLFVLHQFRTDMLPDVQRIVGRDGLQLVQHVDGFGTPGQKLDTYRAVARPRTFAMGFKLFYDEDVQLMGPRAVHRVRPTVRFVSYQ